MVRSRHLLNILSTLLLAAGCAPPDVDVAQLSDEELRDRSAQTIPDSDSLTMGLSSAGTAPGFTSPQLGALASGNGVLPGVGASTQSLLGISQQLVLTGTAHPITGTAKVVFGPVGKGAVTWRYTAELEHTGGRFMLEARPTAAPDSAFVPVVLGILARPSTSEAHGKLGIDLDALKSVDPTARAEGKILSALAWSNKERSVCVRVQHFTIDPALANPLDVDAGCQVLLPSHETRVLAAFRHDDRSHGLTASDVKVQLRFIPGVGGRAEAEAKEENAVVSTSMKTSTCWDVAAHEVYYQLELCTGVGGCLVNATVGNAAACRPEVTLSGPDFIAALGCDGSPGGSSGGGAGATPGSVPTGAPTEMPPVIN